ncbi:bifunctional 3,4-dihydroxy-2-butanone-4-phosphate synthase/GTP cyclohydrolase II [Maribellus maritimus]|uniref:bifunctional 3,4-dihydroxy-2-butanone-4-phosphate synthase/GTP cyclohydrolase II n=1 Tax=Maribellus maritimus TaxID=2870838 RepID=UPI001EEA1C27|nr:bifunctional 3,4-dihydroxy-2-butanone-4-phosphate synthase/GTP cyclohydrolase II [Maribellus maritimus]MCG6186439.1 bifunctional 3,4-dihydroxy-2-butanone-4-phosphate synthase/GTP cyclohydrolase II [Maribellus maritimus]
MSEIKLNTIPEAITAIRNGELVIVVDDEDRENEGDFIVASELVSPEIVNFMTIHGRGLICIALTEQRCDELDLDLMVGKNTSYHETQFTVSVDAIHPDVTTGISAKDRAITVKMLVDQKTKPGDLGRPGHIFPLKAKDRGVLRRSGHTEAAVDLARLAGLYPSGVLVEIMNEDGTMARLPQLNEIAKKFDLKLISIKDLISFLFQSESLIERGEEVMLPTKFGDFRIVPFRQKSNGAEHVALIKGQWEANEPILARVHSSCMTGDIFGSLRCECGDQLQKAMEMIDKEGKGVIVYMMQEGRGIGLLNKIAAYKLQDQGLDTIDANIHLGFKADERDYGVGAQILRNLGVTKMRLLTNNPVKRVGLEGFGLEVVEILPVEIEPNEHNQKYLKTKRDRMGHHLRNFNYDR